MTSVTMKTGSLGYPTILFLGTLLASPILVGCSSATDRAGGPTSASAGPGADSHGGGGALTGGGTGGGTGADDSGGWSTGGDGSGGAPNDDTGAASTGSTGDTGTTGAPACDDVTPVELFLSPDDSNSMSSPVQAREAVLSDWGGLYGVPIRPWEFLNYYSFDYPPAAAGEVAVTTELVPDPSGDPAQYLLQIAVSSPTVTDETRASMNLTLVLDTSGSMSGPPMDMLKESCRALASKLRAGDVVSMVTWNTDNAVILGAHQVSGPSDPTLLGAIDALEAGGGTDLNGGLTAGYDLATQYFDPNRINRLILISDGGANVGVTDEQVIAEHAGGNDEDGIYMVGVGVGTTETYNDLLMDTVTDVGKGASVFIPSKDEAWKIFADRFISTLDVAARDVRVKLDLPPGFEIVSFSGEEYSADPQAIEPQHLAPNDAMVFYQTIRTCAPELVDDGATVGVTVRWKDARTFAERQISQETTFANLLAAPSAQLRKGAAIFAYAQALEAARDEPGPAADDARAQAQARVGDALAALPGDADLLEIQAVLAAL